MSVRFDGSKANTCALENQIGTRLMMMNRRRGHKRLYFLDGRVISSARVSGVVHTARKTLREECMCCHCKVRKGQKYVMLNVIGADPIHLLRCYDPGDEAILGIRRTTARQQYGVPCPAVVCQRFRMTDAGCTQVVNRKRK